jgi:homoserine kinase
MIVRVPASSANLGPGLDALGMALTIHAEAGVADDVPMPERAQLLDGHHPAQIAFERAGGRGSLWLRCPIPAGRGLGFSGAVRVAGLLAAHAQRSGETTIGPDVHRSVLSAATELEGHADNVAASLLGGVVATAGGRAIRIPLAVVPVVVLWVPESTTSTEASRGRFAPSVAFTDAVFNVGRTALLVAALASGEVDCLRTATEDRLHQQVRLADSAGEAAIDAALQAGAWCAWLSGSGPTVAALCSPPDAARVAEALPEGGQVKRVQIDLGGATVRRHAAG